jgi:hypothetical protein
VRRDSHGIYEIGGILGYRTGPHSLLLLGGSVLWQEISGSQVLNSQSPQINFDDHSRFVEAHFGALFNFKENTQRGFFLTPVLQWGSMNSFGVHSYEVSGYVNFGYQFGAAEKRKTPSEGHKQYD